MHAHHHHHHPHPGHLAQTPSPKRRKLVPVVPRATPGTLSDLLSAFGARETSTSASKMNRRSGSHTLRTSTGVSYAESPGSSVQTSPMSMSSFEDTQETSTWNDEVAVPGSEDELMLEDVIHAVPRGTAAKLAVQQQAATELPSRSRRPGVSYVRPVHRMQKKQSQSTSRFKTKKRLLTSDADGASRPSPDRAHTETARGLVRREIALHTKPKRDAFLLANKHYFTPLLPANNYIAKLQQSSGELQHDDVPYMELAEQPAGVTAVMKPYQLQGLSFLLHMHDNGMSAILGDEMGLGKTLQTLSLFQYLAENKPTTGEHRPCLVVCPLSVLSSWVSEAKKWVPGLNVVRFHGPKAERDRFKKEALDKKHRFEGRGKRSGRPIDAAPGRSNDRIDLFITTYDTFKAEEGWFKRSFVWRYCVLDEGHMIKNEKSNMSMSLQGLSAEYRLVLTGTPLQNNLKEMWALLHWLIPEVFTEDTADDFRKAFDLTKGSVSTSFMDSARYLLELIMLRRMKSSPGVDLGLPPKEEVLLYLPLTPMQRFWYQRLLTRSGSTALEDIFSGARSKEAKALQQEAADPQLALLEKAGKAFDDAEAVDTTDVWAQSRAIMEEAVQAESPDKKGAWQKLMNLLMQLRKVCNHPYLLPGAAPPEYTIGEHVMRASAKFIVLDKLIEELVVKKGKKVLIFSGFTRTLNLCEELFYYKGTSTSDPPFRYARLDGGTSRAQRNLSIRLFNDKKSDYKVMLLSTRAGGLGINLTSATDVVFLDEDWNPQVTLQAEARAHRIGQTQKVTIYKLCTQGTVEEQMMGRIRKKLYLSAKITESMRNIHSVDFNDKKRKRQSSSRTEGQDDAPHLDTASLQSLIRRGAQTLARPEIEVEELLKWDWQTTLEKCKDKPVDALVADQHGDVDEQEWLNSMEKVETAVFEGKKHQKEIEKKAQVVTELSRADRRAGKNTTVEIDGFMITKESLDCAEWEAVPTLAGKDPRLAEYKKEKKAAINHQDFCQSCWDGGEVVVCSSCPRSYHVACLDADFQAKSKGKMNFFCPQHECHDCGGKTGDVGGLVYRCRWCVKGFCEDCLDWDKTKLIGASLPEYEMLNFGKIDQAHYIDCSHCIAQWEVDPDDRKLVEREKTRIQNEYTQFQYSLDGESQLQSGAEKTPDTMSEVATPAVEEPPPSFHANPRSSAKSQKGALVVDLSSDIDKDLSHAHPARSSAKKAKLL